MLATRPAPVTTEAEAASGAQEKGIPEVDRDDRKPLLDLDDVAQFESELAACFDAPPLQPLNMRREPPVPSVAPWPPAAAASQLVDVRYVPRLAPVVPQHAVPTNTTVAEHGLLDDTQQEEQEAEAETETETKAETDGKSEQQTQSRGPSDFSSLYTPQRMVSSGQLYPSLPTAPSTQALRGESTAEQGGASASTSVVPTAPPTEASNRSSSAEQHRAAVEPSALVKAATAAVAARREAGPATNVAGGSSDTSIEVVEDLLSENEKLRLIIQDMADELERVNRNDPATAGVAVGRGASGPSASPPSQTQSRDMAQFAGAQAEAARQRNERGSRLQDQDQERTEQPGQLTRRTEYVHFKCENCPQWLKVPGHAQLIFCPTCSHTSQMVTSSIIHRPAGSTASSSRSPETGVTGRQEIGGIMGFLRSIFVS